jgi:tetratricopeptide (TPR) repeat protein
MGTKDQFFQQLIGNRPWWMPAAVACVVVGIVSGPAVARAAGPPELPEITEARRLYNQGRYEEAIQAATRWRDVAPWRPVALLILARSGLERHRQTARPDDLSAAREALRAIDASQLDARDQVELLIGLGQALYLEESFSAAAEVFDGAVEQADGLGPRARDQLVDWWATALDRQAQSRPPSERAAIYDRILAEMTAELRRDARGAAASYWVAAASRARGDVERAWDAAMAGWVRGQLTTDLGAALRPDIDRLMLEGIIPDRARRLAPAPDHLDEVITGMAAEWDAFKTRWTADRSQP